MPAESAGGLQLPLDSDPIADWPSIIATLVEQLDTRTPRMILGRITVTPSAADVWTRRTVTRDLSMFDDDLTKWSRARVFTTVNDALTSGGGGLNSMGTIVSGGVGDPASVIGISVRRFNTTPTEVTYGLIQIPKDLYLETT